MLITCTSVLVTKIWNAYISYYSVNQTVNLARYSVKNLCKMKQQICFTIYF